jgi:hypothetical protein
MSNLLNYLKNKISFGKGIVKVLHSNKTNHNIIYKEMIKWDCNNTSLLYPYGNFSTINYSLISKELKPFQIISNNDILKIDNITKINNENIKNIEIIYFGKKIENNNTITYEIKDDSKVFFLVYTGNNTKKIIFYLL